MKRPNTPEYNDWRHKVLKRDKYKCQWPGCNSRNRCQCHHIRTWSENGFLRYDVDNGITLCKDHHESIKNKEHLYISLFLQVIGSKK